MINLLRIDPVVDVIKKIYTESKLENLNEADIRYIIDSKFKNKEYIECIALSYQAINLYPKNLKFKLNYFDALWKLGFFLDAQNFLEKIFFTDNLKNVFTLFRLVDLYYQQGKYDEVLINFQENLDLVLQHENLFKFYLKILEEMRLHHIYNNILEDDLKKFPNLINDYNKKQIKVYSLQDLINISSNIGGNIDKCLDEVLDIVWGLHHQGEKSLLFFKMAVQIFQGENSVSLRKIYFLSKAKDCFPFNIEFLYNYYQNLCFRKFYEFCFYSLQNVNLKKILKNPLINSFERNRIYFFYIKINALVKDKKNTLINIEDAYRYDLLKPFTLDLTRQISICINDNLPIKSKFQIYLKKLPSDYLKQVLYILDLVEKSKNSNTIKEVDLILTGQMRGGINTISDFQNFIKNEKYTNVSFSTWNFEAFFPARPVSLTRVFGRNFIKELPQEYINLKVFSNKFPYFWKKLQDMPNRNLCTDKLYKFIPNLHIHIEDEKEFDDKFNKASYKINGKNYQAKMFYHFYKMRNLFSSSHVIVRKRPDIRIHFACALKFYIEALYNTRNTIYISYFDHDLGFGDRFHIGTWDALYKTSMIWDASLKFDRLVYADFFDDITHLKAAEHLISAHLLAFGISIRYLHNYKEEFIQPNFFIDLDLKSEFEHDYLNLSDIEKNKLANFYRQTLEVLH